LLPDERAKADFRQLLEQTEIDRTRPQRALLFVLPGDCPDLHQLPWELLCDPEDGVTLHALGVCLVRSFHVVEPAVERVRRIGRLVFRYDVPFFRPGTDWKTQLSDLESFFRPWESKIDKRAGLVERWQRQGKRLSPPGGNPDESTIMHVVCHGAVENSRPVLLARRDWFREMSIEPNRFVDEVPGGCKLIFLNACSTAVRPDREHFPLNNFPDILLGRHKTSHIICNHRSIRTDDASLFANVFYAHLVGGDSLLEAVWWARQELWKKEAIDSPDWSVPVVYCATYLDKVLGDKSVGVYAPPPEGEAGTPPAAEQKAARLRQHIVGLQKENLSGRQRIVALEKRIGRRLEQQGRLKLSGSMIRGLIAGFFGFLLALLLYWAGIVATLFLGGTLGPDPRQPTGTDAMTSIIDWSISAPMPHDMPAPPKLQTRDLDGLLASAQSLGRSLAGSSRESFAATTLSAVLCCLIGLAGGLLYWFLQRFPHDPTGWCSEWLLALLFLLAVGCAALWAMLTLWPGLLPPPSEAIRWLACLTACVAASSFLRQEHHVPPVVLYAVCMAFLELAGGGCAAGTIQLASLWRTVLCPSLSFVALVVFEGPSARQVAAFAGARPGDRAG
jgi:hypothetical protein